MSFRKDNIEKEQTELVRNMLSVTSVFTDGRYPVCLSVCNPTPMFKCNSLMLFVSHTRCHTLSR